MYVQPDGSSERHTRSSVAFPASARIRAWNAASSVARPWRSPASAAACSASWSVSIAASRHRSCRPRPAAPRASRARRGPRSPPRAPRPRAAGRGRHGTGGSPRSPSPRGRGAPRGRGPGSSRPRGPRASPRSASRGIAPAEDVREQALLDLLREDVPRDRAVVCHRSLGGRRASSPSLASVVDHGARGSYARLSMITPRHRPGGRWGREHDGLSGHVQPRGQGRARPRRRGRDRARRSRSALVGAGAQVAVANHTLEYAEAAAAGSADAGGEAIGVGGRRHERGRRRAGRRRDRRPLRQASTSSSTASAAARARSCTTPRPTRATRGTGSWSSTSASTVLADPGGGPRDDRGGQRRRGRQHQLRPVGPRHQRRLLGVRRRQGRDRVADPPVGDRVGQARHPRQRHPAHVRRHAPGGDAARRPGVQGGHRRAGSRSAASAARTT